MKNTIIAAALLGFVATPAQAEHWDVIGFQLKETCSLSKYMAIVKDFNDWGKTQGYAATVLTPVQSDDQAVMYWIGKSANAAAFGRAWDSWRDAQADPNTPAAKLQARFAACSTNKTRSAYDAW